MIINVVNHAPQHVGIDAEMLVPQPVETHVLVVLPNVKIHVKLSVKILKVLHVLIME